VASEPRLAAATASGITETPPLEAKSPWPSASVVGGGVRRCGNGLVRPQLIRRRQRPCLLGLSSAVARQTPMKPDRVLGFCNLRARGTDERVPRTPSVSSLEPPTHLALWVPSVSRSRFPPPFPPFVAPPSPPRAPLSMASIHHGRLQALAFCCPNTAPLFGNPPKHPRDPRLNLQGFRDRRECSPS
jgi:hypothetical protein